MRGGLAGCGRGVGVGGAAFGACARAPTVVAGVCRLAGPPCSML
jgi:hypothetical protein